MKRILAALLALALSVPAFGQSYVDEANATYTYVDENGDSLRLFGTPCTTPGIVKDILPQFRGDFRAAEAIVGGVKTPLCYDAVDLIGGHYYVTGESVEFLFPKDQLILESKT